MSSHNSKNTAGTQDRDRSRDKALLIGIEYQHPLRDGVPPLFAPHKDVREFKDHLIRKWGYLNHNITVMLDRIGYSPNLLPTRVNILREMDKLVLGAGPGDRRVFLFAGHCYQLVNHDNKEADHLDEAILVLDHNGEPIDQEGRPLDPENISDEDKRKLEGVIVDNEMRKRLVDSLHPGAKLTSFFDTCHSGTLLDLPHYYSSVEKPLPLDSQDSPKRRRIVKKLSQGPEHELAVLEDGSKSIPAPVSVSPSFDLPQCSSPLSMEFSIGDEDNREPRSMSGQASRARHTREKHSFERRTLIPVTSCSSECSGSRTTPRVLSIAPAEDHQLVYENPDSDGSRSFTSSLITVMDEAEPGELTLKKLIERVWYRICQDINNSLVKIYKQRRQSLNERFRKNRRHIIKNKIPTPQIGGTHNLNLDDPVTL